MSSGNPVTLGFVGTGTITCAIVTGLQQSKSAFDIVVSPRNARVAADRDARFERVRVAASNQAVLDASDVLFLAVRPQVADEVLRELRFRADHHVISLVATYSRDRIARLVAPAARITCAVPQPTVAGHSGPTVLYPSDPVASALFAEVGAVFEVDSEAQFQALFTATAAMASYFTLLGTIASWLDRHGVDPAQSRRYVATMFRALSAVPLDSARSFVELAQEFKTPGGLNEQFAGELRQHGVFDACSSGLDSILRRVGAGGSGKSPA